MHARAIGTGSAIAFMKRFEHHAAMILLISQGDGRIVEANPAAVHYYDARQAVALSPPFR
ncbi:MAG: hypothetical protein ABSG38_01555 [Spirochaetia bacterium]